MKEGFSFHIIIFPRPRALSFGEAEQHVLQILLRRFGVVLHGRQRSYLQLHLFDRGSKGQGRLF